MIKPEVMKYLGVLITAAVVLAGVFLVAAPPASLSSFDPQAKALLASMTLDEKIGQMTQAEQNELKDPADVEAFFLGSLFSGGDSDPKEGNSLEAWTNMYDRLQARTRNSRLKIPILFGIDAVHGHNNVLGAVIFPHNIGLGCTRDAALVEKIARATAEEVRATGIQWAFAPCVTVPQDVRWGRTYEGFSQDPAVVAPLGEAAVRGLQGADLANPLAVLACAKHYVGDGGTTFGTARGRLGLDQGDTRVDEATLRRIHLPGYISAIRAGVGTIMPSYNSWNGVKCSASHRLLTEILKDELGFQGFLISDYNALDQLAPNFKDAIAISINAGMDMAMVPSRYREYFTNLKALVEEGKVPMARVDDAVTRILRVKFAMGMMDPNRSQLADRSLQKKFGSPEHRALARQAVRESIVLLKNDRKVLPLSKSAPVYVTGKSADDIGNQCGGWTISWQGKSGAVTTGGTTILTAIRGAGKLAASPAEAKVGIAVIGERPYAEFQGDRAELPVVPEDVAAVESLKATGIPVVTVVISGRPLVLGSVLEKSDAVIAAWLPGTEGAGVADVLFGAYKPTGKLGFAWAPQFQVGYGLKY